MGGRNLVADLDIAGILVGGRLTVEGAGALGVEHSVAVGGLLSRGCKLHRHLTVIVQLRIFHNMP